MNILKSLVLSSGLLAASITLASGDHDGDHGHMSGMDHSQMPGMNMEHSGGHRHDKWVEPPAQYAGKTWSHWDDKAIAARGEQLFAQNCVACHGKSGQGNGPAAAGLAHKPADLINNFHEAPGKGDDYLFWRISEGGQVSPFREMQSAMPSFKRLSEQDRWAILTYVHQRFHGGFPMKSGRLSAKTEVAHEEHGHAHAESGHTH